MRRSIIIIICAICLLAGCSPTPGGQPENSLSFFAMDTYMNIRAWGADNELMNEIEGRVADLEAVLSSTADTSEISALNRGETVTLSGETESLLREALRLCGLTNGALDISVYPIVKAWGFTTEAYRVPDQSEIDGLLENVDYSRISLDGGSLALPEGMEIDLGSVAKGYTGDVIVSMLKEAGIKSAILDLGGNIQALGKKADGSLWRIAVRDPDGTDTIGVLSVADKAVITSGGYERYFIDDEGVLRWHIMDPETGYPADSGLLSVTIIGDSGVYCDALSTALFVMGLDDAVSFHHEHSDFDMVLVADDGVIYVTRGINEAFEPADGSGYKVRVIDDD